MAPALLLGRVQDGHVARSGDLVDQQVDEQAGQAPSPERLVGAHRADLDVAGRAQALAGHGDERAVGRVPNAEVGAELDGCDR